MLLLERKGGYRSFFCRIAIPVIYTIFVGFRSYNVGVDTCNYYDHFYIYGQWGCDFVEPGFDWLNRFLYSIHSTPSVLLTVIAAISVFFLYLTLNPLSGKIYTLSAFCLYTMTYFLLINGIRQAITCSIFLYSISFILRRQPLKYLLCILFGSLFHTSILLMLVVYFIGNHKFNNKVYVILYIISFVGLFVNILNYIPNIQFIDIYSKRYLENIRISDASSLGFIFTTLYNIFVLYLMIIYDSFNKNPLLSNIVFIAFILANLTFSLPVFGRMTPYFAFATYLLFPKILYDQILKPINKSFILLIFMLFVLTLLIYNISSPANDALPYTFYWEDKYKI